MARNSSNTAMDLCLRGVPLLPPDFWPFLGLAMLSTVDLSPTTGSVPTHLNTAVVKSKPMKPHI